MPLYSDTIYALLISEVEAAKKRFTNASVEFREVMNDVPSGFQQPDGVVRIEQASREWKSASEAYRSALHRFHAFISDDIIPDEFREPGKYHE